MSKGALAGIGDESIATDAAAVVKVTNLRVRFGALLAVHNVPFPRRRDAAGLIGPNGAGKTTLLRTIAGLQSPTRGTVEVLGERLSPDSLHQIGFTPDVPPVYDELTVRQFLQFVGKGYDLPPSEIRERHRLLAGEGVADGQGRPEDQGLCRGMKQRVGLARTLLPNPALILLDEPAAGLDPAGRVQFRQLLADLRDQGKTIIVSSHILADMDEYCTHIAIMTRRGDPAIRHGRPDHQRARRRSPAVRAHAGAPGGGPGGRMLETLEGATEIERGARPGDVRVGSSRDQAAEALARLVGMRLPMASFAPVAANLEEAYLRAECGRWISIVRGGDLACPSSLAWFRQSRHVVPTSTARADFKTLVGVSTPYFLIIGGLIFLGARLNPRDSSRIYAAWNAGLMALQFVFVVIIGAGRVAGADSRGRDVGDAGVAAHDAAGGGGTSSPVTLRRPRPCCRGFSRPTSCSG